MTARASRSSTTPSNQKTARTSDPARHRFAVIMAGGTGTRFWPWSRERMPKQLLSLAGPSSMLADTVARLRGVVPDSNILVVTNQRLVDAVAEALPHLPASSILGEPAGRNTAPCIGWAALELLQRDPDAVMSVLPADHVLGEPGRFRADLLRGYALAAEGRHLITFGIRPTEPATGYGYIRAGKPLPGHPEAMAVAAFVEKPTLAVARRYMASGKYFWNSGMFLWKASHIWQELERHLPELAAGLSRMERHRRGRSIPAAKLARAFPALPSISIDYGVLERSASVAMIPASFSWSDIGSWDAAASLWPSDADGNASRDPLVAIDARGNVVASRGKPVALLGVSDLVVVDAGDALLVCPRSRCQDVRQIVARLGDAKAGSGRKLRELL